MSDFKTRLQEEKQELDDKKGKLGVFLTGGGVNNIEPLQANLLHIQYSLMQSYSDVLKLRLSELKD